MLSLPSPTAVLLIFIYLAHLTTSATKCNVREAKHGKICVCNSTYCDTVPEILTDMTSGGFQLYVTSEENPGFSSSSGTFSNTSSSSNFTITISTLNTTYQTIIGFGGAFTDATGENILTLENKAQEKLLEAYFGDSGLRYSIGRVPIGGTDFSSRGYTYCDDCNNTMDLSNWALQAEDKNYKIPFIQKAMELRGAENLKLFSSAWSAPTFMKTNNQLNFFGKVKDKYYGLWAEYYIKFFDAYKQNNISFWGVTTQNEPIDGLVGLNIQNNGFTSSEISRWIADFLGPVIRNSNYRDLKIMANDDIKILLYPLIWFILSNKTVNSYVDGIAFHWYTDYLLNDALTLPVLQFSEETKDKFYIASEACNGFLHPSSSLEKPVELGSWDRGQKYIENIISDLKYNFAAWTDWNMALNTEATRKGVDSYWLNDFNQNLAHKERQEITNWFIAKNCLKMRDFSLRKFVLGGPNWIENNVDAPIIVNSTAGEFYKQPMFYALGHFSKFVPPGSVRLETDVSFWLNLSGVDAISFLRPDGKIALIVNVKNSDEKTIFFDILGHTESITLEKHSINTILLSP